MFLCEAESEKMSISDEIKRDVSLRFLSKQVADRLAESGKALALSKSIVYNMNYISL